MPTLAIMFTMTTYGTWLRGDARGWIENGIIFPPNPTLESIDRLRMKDTPFYFSPEEQFATAEAIGHSLTTRLNLDVLALCLQSWHSHYVVAATSADVADIAKCAKDAARWHLRPGRRIWGTDYDKRFCFDEATVHRRVNYVERHNLQSGWAARPWSFLK